MSIKISVIIPVYNTENYLEECLNSVLNQTIKDLEIICIDDGSADKSVEIIKRYIDKDNRIILIDNKNQGVSEARNKGLAFAKGKFITFIDSDDYYCSNDYLEKLLNACEKYDADISVCGIIRGTKNKRKIILEFCKEKITSDYYEKLKYCDVPDSNYLCNKLYRRSSILDTKLKFPRGMIYEDMVYTCQILYLTYNLVTVPNIYYFYRKRSNSLIQSKDLKSKNDYKKAEKFLSNFLKEHGINISDLKTEIKKYKIFGITYFKTITKQGKRKNILFNLITWTS